MGGAGILRVRRDCLSPDSLGTEFAHARCECRLRNADELPDGSKASRDGIGCRLERPFGPGVAPAIAAGSSALARTLFSDRDHDGIWSAEEGWAGRKRSPRGAANAFDVRRRAREDA